MAATDYTPDDIEAFIAGLEEAIASGARRVTFMSAGTRREVEYNSLSDLLRAIDYWKAKRPSYERPSLTTLASFSSF
ncbi:phage head-tail joining protein [Antarcticirhabdus aurantiaca]|uniref:Uncharacterized protein n=1 Tax=Antarcticirhabdus aurantiaca TaxID=2606717 RepID=A0ACD4NJB9_9HYPH|nr:hypothetical protein OXU80_18610 [Jeongeuplla avenae]